MLTYFQSLDLHHDITDFDFEEHREAYESLLNNTGIKYQYIQEFPNGFGVQFTGNQKELASVLLLEQEFWRGKFPEFFDFPPLTSKEILENIFDQN